MSSIRYAVAAAIAATAANAAHALDISTYAGNSATNVNVYISGSTAVDNTLLNTELSLGGTINGTTVPVGICAANTIDVYQIGGPTERLTYCSASANAGSGITAGTPIAIFKESNIGSVNGVTPLLNAAANASSGVFFLDPSKFTDSSCGAGTAQSASTFFSAYTLHCNCSAVNTTTANLIPTGGVADVEGALLRNSPGGTALNSAAITANLTAAEGLDVLWGVGVTKNLFYALQSAEHLADGTKITACNTANNDSPACAPSLSKEQVTSLYTASALFSWNQILGLNNTADNNVYLCRRDVGSGTEASFEAYFMGARCGLSGEVMAPQDGTFVFTNNSTGNVRSCLAAFMSGGTATPFNGDFGTTYTPVHEPGGQWAIGVLSSEVTSGNLSPDDFRMIAVDGVLPTIENAQNGYTPYWSTDVFYVITAGKPNAPAAAPLAVFKAIQGEIGHPGFTALSNSTYAGRPWGNGGDLAPATLFQSTFTPTIPATAATAAINPTNVYTKANGAIAGAAINNCNPPQIFQNLGTPVTTPAPSLLLGNGNVNN